MTFEGSVAYVIPAHNEELVLRSTTYSLVSRLSALPRSEVILVENGSTDRTIDVARELARQERDDNVQVRVEQSAKGYGNALRRGIEAASADLVMLTAADLPFGFSDLDEALKLDPLPDVVIGSKAHPESRVHVSTQRRVMSNVFRLSRRALLGIDVGDTQGTILIRRELASALLARMQSGGYFFSTELVALAARAGHSIVEVPVDYSNPRPDSKVRVVHDSLDVIKDMISLRRRIRRYDYQPTT